MKLISFSLTEQQFIDGTKDVTRRLRWLKLKAGDRLMGCRKCMGRKKGEPLVKLGVIEVVSVRREKLNSLTRYLETGVLTLATEGAYLREEAEQECRREGFPHKTPAEFVQMFCEHMGCKPETIITRIEFKKV